MTGELLAPWWWQERRRERSRSQVVEGSQGHLSEVGLVWQQMATSQAAKNGAASRAWVVAGDEADDGA